MDPLNYVWCGVVFILWGGSVWAHWSENRAYNRQMQILVEQNTHLTDLLAAVKTPWAAEVVQTLQAAKRGNTSDDREEQEELLA